MRQRPKSERMATAAMQATCRNRLICVCHAVSLVICDGNEMTFLTTKTAIRLPWVYFDPIGIASELTRNKSALALIEIGS